MDLISEKSRLILEHDQYFAFLLAGKVLEKPKVDIWMILLPILFVYYMNNFQKFKDGRKTFAAHYMVTRKRALEEAVALAHSGNAADPDDLAKESGIPAEAQNKLAELFAVLIGHYEILLKATGRDFDSLVRSAYKNLTNYLLFINRINNAEKELNMALEPQLATVSAGVNDIISAMEKHTDQIRLKEAHDIFS